MTRSHVKQVEEALKRSTEGTNSSSVDPTSSNWTRNGLVGDDGLSGYAETPSRAATESVMGKASGDDPLINTLDMTPSEDVRYAKELNLAPSDKAVTHDSNYIKDFFDSSPEKEASYSPEKLASQSPEKEITLSAEVIVPTSPLATRSKGKDQKQLNRLSIPEVVIDNGESAKGRASSSTSSGAIATVAELPNPEISKPKKSQSKSIASTAASLSESLDSTPSKGRPKRATAAGKKKYTVDYNKDGTEKKKSVSKDTKEKKSARSSSIASKKGKQRGSVASEVIEIADSEDEDASDDDSRVSIAIGKEKMSLRRKKSRLSSASASEVNENDDVSMENPDGTTLVESDMEKDESGEEDGEDKIHKPARKGRGSTKTESHTIVSDDGNDEEHEVFKPVRKGRGSTKTESRTAVSDEEEIEREDTEEEETLPTKKRGRVASSSNSRRGKKQRGKKTPELEDEDGEDATRGSINIDDKSKEGDETADVEDEGEKEKEEGEEKQQEVLQDASSRANTKSMKKGKETKREKRKREESEIASTSKSSTSVANSSTSSNNKSFWGKPLKKLKTIAKPRVAGLVKSKIAPLLTIRNAPPAKREAIPIPKSKKAKKEEFLDSDEERERANETSEQRMARYIRENGGGDDDDY